MRIFKRALFGLTSLIFFADISSLYAQTNITVNAGTTVVTIPNAIYGNNAQYYNAANNGTVATYNTAMQVSGCRNIRWPGGSEADIVDWNNLVCNDNGAATTPQFITFLQTFGGTLQPIVNLSGYWCSGGSGSGTSTQFTHAQAVSLAEAWVTWNLTNTGSAKATYWEVGNEVYGNWEQGGQGSTGSTLTGTVYGQYFADYYNGMKAIDSTIKIGAVASPGSTDYTNWTPDMLTAAKAAGVVPDFLIIHNYPVTAGAPASSATDAYILSFPATVATQTTSLNSIVSSALGASYVGQVKYFMTEYNSSLGPDAQTNEYVNAMFCSEWIMEMAKNGWIGANLWATLNGGTPDYGFVNTTTYAPFPNYYVFPMLSGKFGTNMVTCTSSSTTVKAYAAMNASGDLTLYMVNNSPTVTMPATVTVSGFTPAASGQAWVMLPQGTSSSGAPQEAPGLQINGTANPAPSAITSIAGVAQTTGTTFTVSLQPSEMDLIVIPGTSSSAPTNTPTPTVTRTNTPTSTRTNTATSTLTATRTSTVTSTPSRTSTSTPTNTVANTATFTATRTNTPTNTVTSTATLSFTSTKTNSPTSTQTFSPTASATASPSATATKTASSTVANTATPSSTPTASFTATRTNTATITDTSSLTNTVTATPTATRTNTATITSSATATNTVANMTPTPSNTATVTTTVTRTNTVTQTATPTSTNSATHTATATFTNTLANTSTNTATPALTSTASNTATATSTNSPTQTPTNTLMDTPTNTATATATHTATATGTASFTTTNTATKTVTSTATSTPTNTDSPTITGTPTLTPTGTAMTPTFTSTATKTGTSTATSTATNTDTNTTTQTATKTATSTATSTPTNTLADSATPTSTLVDTATSTATSTVSNTATQTTTSTPTNTLADTATNTATPLATLTPTNTLADTVTSTATATSSRTATQTITSTPSLTSTPTNGIIPATNTFTNTATATASKTSTPTVPNTATSTMTLTGTPTEVTVQASQGSNPPASSTQVSGASGVTIQQILLTNPGNNIVTLSSLTLSETQTSTTGITSVSLMDNGTVISATSFGGTTTATFNLISSNTIQPSNGAVTYEVVVSFSTSAPTGNYPFSITAGAGNNGQAVGFNGLPVTGATVTIASATPTPSNTPTNTASPIFTATVTSTSTMVPTSTGTSSPTATPAGNKGVVVYPNPVTGPTVNVLPPTYSGISNVQVEIFTIAFRKVQDETFTNVPSGVAVTVVLTDKSGAPLVDGLYYLVVIVDGHRSIGKLLIIR